MTTTLTGSSSYSNTATAPADGDTRNAASVNTPLQTVLNNTKWLYDHGRIIADSIYSDLGNSSIDITATSYATFNSSGNVQVSVSSVEVGDIIIARAHCSFILQNSGGAVATQGSWKLVVTESTNDYSGNEITGPSITGSNTIIYGPTFAVRRVCASAGTLTVKLQGKVSVADAANNYVRVNGIFLHVQHIRV